MDTLQTAHAILKGMISGGKEKGAKRKKLNFMLGAQNVQTMLRTGKMQEIAREMERYQLGILSLQEIKWKGEGTIQKTSILYITRGKRNRGKMKQVSW